MPSLCRKCRMLTFVPLVLRSHVWNAVMGNISYDIHRTNMAKCFSLGSLAMPSLHLVLVKVAK